MMKLFLRFSIIVALFSCTKSYKVDDNIKFNVLIEDETHKIDLINGVYEVITTNGNKRANFMVSREDLNMIKQYVYKNDFLKNQESTPFSISKSLPISTIKITVVSDKSVYVFSYCSPCYHPLNFLEVKKARRLVEMVENICLKDANVQKLPRTDLYLE